MKLLDECFQTAKKARKKERKIERKERRSKKKKELKMKEKKVSIHYTSEQHHIAYNAWCMYSSLDSFVSWDKIYVEIWKEPSCFSPNPISNVKREKTQIFVIQTQTLNEPLCWSVEGKTVQYSQGFQISFHQELSLFLLWEKNWIYTEMRFDTRAPVQ